MSEPLAPQAVPPSPVAPEKAGGFFQNLVDLYVAPRQAFERIVKSPQFVLPLIGHILLTFAFTGIWLHKMDAREFIKTQIEESGRADKIPAEQREAIIEQQAKFMPIFAWASPVFLVIGIVVVAACLMLIYRFFYSSDVGFRQSFAIVTWEFFAVGIVTTVVIVAVLSLKGDWNLNPQEVVQANLSLFFEKSATAKPLWALLTSIDVFSLWSIFLLATGFGVASRKSTGSAIWGIVVPWVVIVLIKVGWNALM